MRSSTAGPNGRKPEIKEAFLLCVYVCARGKEQS